MVFYSFRKLLIIFGVFLLAVLFVLWYTFSNLRAQRIELKKITHSREILQKLGPALANMQTFEAIRANYAGTHDSKFLDDYNEALKELKADSMILAGLVSKDPAFERLTQLLHEMTLLGDSTNTINGKAGIAITREFQDIVEKLEDKNRKILNSSYANSLTLTSKTFTFVKIISAVLVLVVGISFFLFYRDVNNRKKTEQKLQKFNEQLEDKVLQKTRETRKSEERYRSIIEQASDSIMITDQSGNFLDVNPEMCRLFGYSRNELLKMNVADLVEPEQLRSDPLIFEKLSNGKAVLKERQMVTKNGAVIDVESTIRKLSDGRLLAITRNITEWKKITRQVLESKVQAQKMITRAVLRAEERARNKIGQELHDNVNQILASTKLFLNMARENGGNNSQELLTNSGKLLDTAIDEIRLLSQNEVTPLKGVELKEMIQMLLDKLDQSSKYKIEFTCESCGKIIEDELKLNIYRIVQEQINNIVKHANATEIRIKLSKDDHNLYVLIHDNGRGFNPNKKRSGIGISNMINRIESFNGEIMIDSNEGHGCTLRMKVPC